MRPSRFALIATLAWTLALTPVTAEAQLETFVQAVRALGDATQLVEPARSSAIAAATARLRRALGTWDRNIRTMEAAADGELAAASDERALRLHVELGVAYRARGRFAGALREFDAASRLQPSSSDLQVLRALTLQASGQTLEATTAFNAAWSIDSRNPVIAYYVLRNVDTATERERARALLIDAYERLRADATRPTAPPFLAVDIIPDGLWRAPMVADDAMLKKAFGLLRRAKYDDAIRVLDGRSQPAGADSPRAMLARGQQDEASGRLSGARREYESALDGTLTGRAAVLVGIARLAQVEGDLAGAIDAFNRAVQAAPNDVNIHKELATAYAAQNQNDDAICELVAALLIDPRDAQAHTAIGQLRLDSGHADAAVAAFTRALELAPDRYEVRYALATALTRLGRREDAAKQLALYERSRGEALDRRRRDIAADVEQQESLRRRSTDGDTR